MMFLGALFIWKGSPCFPELGCPSIENTDSLFRMGPKNTGSSWFGRIYPKPGGSELDGSGHPGWVKLGYLGSSGLVKLSALDWASL